MDGVCHHEICVVQSQKSNPAYGNIILASMRATWRRRKHEDFDAVHEFPPQTSVHVGKAYAETSCIVKLATQVKTITGTWQFKEMKSSRSKLQL